MMKTNYLFIGMAALMMAACSNDENEPQVNDGRVAVSFAGGITLTRATTDAWEANDGIGIYMLEHGTKTVADGASNRKYVTTAGDGKFTPAGAEQTIYFPLSADEKVDFIAYCPQTDLTGDVYKVDVSDQKNPANIDLLRSDNAVGKDKSTNTVDLEFFHRLSVTRNFAASLFRNIKYFTLRKLYLCRKWMQKRLQKTTTTGITLPNFDFLA